MSQLRTLQSLAFSKLLDAHTSSAQSTLSLTKNLGDGYLIEKNVTYRTVRRAAMLGGYRFCLRSRVTAVYNAIPLLSLWDILESGRIPYADNVSGLQVLANKSRGFRVSPLFLQRHFQRNYLLHETTHVCCFVAAKARNITRNIAIQLVDEAAAICSEILAHALCRDSLEEFFLSLNTFIGIDSRRNLLVRKCVSRFGIVRSIEILILAFARAQLLETSVAPQALDQLAHGILGQIPSGDLALARAVLRYPADRNRRFREETTQIYFRFLGKQREFTQVLQNVSALTLIETPLYRKHISCLAEFLGESQSS